MCVVCRCVCVVCLGYVHGVCRYIYMCMLVHVHVVAREQPPVLFYLFFSPF